LKAAFALLSHHIEINATEAAETKSKAQREQNLRNMREGQEMMEILGGYEDNVRE
jgi:hypothetical protein